MNIKIFDSYNIRARLSVYIIIIAPIILTLYVLYDHILYIDAIFLKEDELRDYMEASFQYGNKDQ